MAATQSRQVVRPSAALNWQARAALGFSAAISSAVWPSSSPQPSAICASISQALPWMAVPSQRLCSGRMLSYALMLTYSALRSASATV